MPSYSTWEPQAVICKHKCHPAQQELVRTYEDLASVLMKTGGLEKHNLETKRKPIDSLGRAPLYK